VKQYAQATGIVYG
jgi:hypothetical protein